jgi:hypothetical protein
VTEIDKALGTRGKAVAIVLAVVFAAALWWVWLFVFSSDAVFRLPFSNEENRVQLLELRDRIKLGQNYEEVLEHFWANEGRHRELRLTTDSRDCWYISMPHEVLATDWLLYVSFDNARVSAIKVRSYDGPKFPGMPDDIGSGLDRCGF